MMLRRHHLPGAAGVLARGSVFLPINHQISGIASKTETSRSVDLNHDSTAKLGG